jgi:type II secretory pathway component PulJ
MPQKATAERANLPVRVALPAAILGQTQATRLLLQRRGAAGFTLAELLVSVGVLVLLVFLATQLLNSTAAITTLGHKQMDADAQARQLLDRMAIDFAQMVKRSDVDYYVKSSAASPLRRVLQPGNDQIAFYGAVPGYYPPTGSQSPVSLVAYRVNSNSTLSLYNKVERLGKGLVWNAVSTTDTPVVFMPIPIASPIPAAELPSPTPNPLPTPAWPQAGNMTTDTAYELVGSQVFRFEYYYLLKDGSFSDIPWISPHNSLSGMQDVSAIVVDIAVIDPKSKVLISDCLLSKLNGASPPAGCTHGAAALVDYAAGMTSGQLLASWRSVIDSNTIGLPRLPVSGIRLYERFIYLSPPTL